MTLFNGQYSVSFCLFSYFSTTIFIEHPLTNCLYYGPILNVVMAKYQTSFLAIWSHWVAYRSVGLIIVVFNVTCVIRMQGCNDPLGVEMAVAERVP